MALLQLGLGLLNGYLSRSAQRDFVKKQERMAAEAQRQRMLGSQKIEAEFAQFDDDFYERMGKAVRDVQLPQLQDQYDTAMRGDLFNFARSRNLGGSAAIDQQGKRAAEKAQGRVQIEANVKAHQNQLRDQIHQSKQNLYALNNQISNANQVANLSQGAGQRFANGNNVANLNNVFNASMQPYLGYQIGQRQNQFQTQFNQSLAQNDAIQRYAKIPKSVQYQQ